MRIAATLNIEVPHWIDKKAEEKYSWYVTLASSASLFDLIELGNAEIEMGGSPFFADVSLEANPVSLLIVEINELTGEISMWVADGTPYVTGDFTLGFRIGAKVLWEGFPNAGISLETSLQFGTFTYDGGNDEIGGFKGTLSTSIGPWDWSGAMFIDTDFDVTTGGDVDNYQLVTRERVQRALAQSYPRMRSNTPGDAPIAPLSWQQIRTWISRQLYRGPVQTSPTKRRKMCWLTWTYFTLPICASYWIARPAVPR